MNGDMAVTAVSRELGRDLRQDEMDLLHYPRVCAESGGGGANQVIIRPFFQVYGYTVSLNIWP